MLQKGEKWGQVSQTTPSPRKWEHSIPHGPCKCSVQSMAAFLGQELQQSSCLEWHQVTSSPTDDPLQYFTSIFSVWIHIMMMPRIIWDLCWALKDVIISLNIIQFQLKPFFSTCQSKRAPVSPSRRITSRRIMLEWEHAHGIDFLPPTMHLLRSSDPTKFNKCFRAWLVPAKEAYRL